jgi:hypothetical protein
MLFSLNVWRYFQNHYCLPVSHFKKGVKNVDHITKPKSAYGHGEKLDDELKRALKVRETSSPNVL